MAWVPVTEYVAEKVLAYVKANERVPEGYSVKHDRDPVVLKRDDAPSFDFRNPEADFAADIVTEIQELRDDSGRFTKDALSTSLQQAIPDQPFPDAVDARLAAAPTVVAAAEAAVDDAIAGKDILEGGTFASDYNNDLAFAVVDEDGRRTWIEVGPDGQPTDRAKAAFGFGDFDAGLNGMSFAVVGDDQRRTWVEADLAGKPTTRAAQLIAAALTAAGFGPVPTQYRDPSGVTHPIVSGPEIACSGDSLTAGAGGGGTTYPSVLATLTGKTVLNLGVGGETSRTIAGRVGAWPMLVTVSGGQIPASGGVTVTLASVDGGTVAPLLQGGSGAINPCSIAGVVGTLSYATGTYTFTRTTSGSVVTVRTPVPLITSTNDTIKDRIHVMWWGQNDGWSGSTSIAQEVINRINAANVSMTALAKRWLVVGPTTSSNATRAPIAALCLAAFGRRFVDLGAYLASYASLADAGITPTSQDDTDIAAGIVPTSLRSDSTHLNAAGYTLVAKQVYARMGEMGWL